MPGRQKVKDPDPPPEMGGLPTRLGRAMADRRFTQKKLEKLSTISQGTISKTLNGENLRGITAATVCLLAIALDVPVGWLLAGEGDEVPSREREPESGVTPSSGQR